MPSRARFVRILTYPRNAWPRAWSGNDDRAWVSFASAAAKAVGGIDHKGISAVGYVGRRRANERVDIVGIGGERAIEKTARLRNMVRGPAAMEPGQALKKEVHRIGIGRLFGVARLNGGDLSAQRVRQAPDDFVLHVEEIGERLVKPLRPQMTASLGVDELHVDAHAVSAALNAALEDIANVQVAADRLHVERLALVGERRVAGDHDRAADT